jgi:hypothetical protein
VQTLKTIAVAAVLAIAATGTASAAGKCSQKAFAGVWLVSSSAGQLCLLEFSSKGDITESRCYIAGRFDSSVGSLSGTVKVASNCKISGEISQKIGKKTEKLTISGQGAVSKDTNVIEATGSSKTGTVVLAGFQQW